MSGTDFLDEVRQRFSRVLLARIANAGREAFARAHARACPAFPEPALPDTVALYDLRRDWTGVTRTEVTRRREPEPSDEMLGLVFYKLMDRGAELVGANIILGGERIRLVQSAGRMFHRVKERFISEPPAAADADLTICIGALDDGGIPAHLVRGARKGSVVRPGLSGTWCTHLDFEAHLPAA